MQKGHLKAPDNWVNDPNGFICFKGEYHVFYQYFPYSPQWGTMHWGHAVSRDLVHWEHRGIALFPTVHEDQNGCFSGSAVEVDEKLCLVYTGVRYEAANPRNIHLALNEQFEASQLMICSDNGYHFDNWNGKKVIIPAINDTYIGHRTHTRDPKIWRGKDAWYIILGSSLKGKQGEVLFYRSTDMETWTYRNRMVMEPSMGWMSECPDYFEVGDGGVLLLSAMGIPQNGEAEENHAVCYLADFDEGNCEMKLSEKYQFLDYGLDLYAPQTTVDKDGRRIMIAWLRMPEPVDGKWIGMYCMPRVIEVENRHIYFRLHPNIRNAFSKEIEDIAQAEKAGCRLELEMRDGENLNLGGLIIGRKESRIYVNRNKVYPENENYNHLLSVSPEICDGNRLEILADEHSVEIYINDGEYVITNAVYHLGKQMQTDIKGEIKIYTMND